MKTMLNNFCLAYRIKSAYVYNQIIYGLQHIPLIGKVFPNSLYGAYDIKVLVIIVSLLKEFFKIFVYKGIYIFTFLSLPLALYNQQSTEIIINIYLFLALIGSFSNTEMFNPSKDKYYIIILMKMNAKDYAVSNFVYFLLSTFIGHFVSLLILLKLPLPIALLLALTTIALKIIVISFYLYRMKKKNIIINENKPASMPVYICLSLLFLAGGYLLPVINVIMPCNAFYTLAITLCIASTLSFSYILKFNKYRHTYKALLKDNNVFYSNDAKEKEKQNSRNYIVSDTNINSNKEGYAYFNDLFVKRHRKILSDRAKKTAAIIFIVAIIAEAFAFIEPTVGTNINKFILTLFPYMLLLMYFINTGNTVTNAMFINCDHSMLAYRFYRQPKMLLGLFRERLKTTIKINLLPTLVLAISMCLLLLFNGGTDNIINYVIILLSIFSMSILFSVHNLVIYYLLQPYSIDMEMKSTTYGIVSAITYIACYNIPRFEMPLILFGSTIIIFAVLYSFISLFLIYRFAPKTFRLR